MNEHGMTHPKTCIDSVEVHIRSSFDIVMVCTILLAAYRSETGSCKKALPLSPGDCVKTYGPNITP